MYALASVSNGLSMLFEVAIGERELLRVGAVSAIFVGSGRRTTCKDEETHRRYGEGAEPRGP